MGFYSENKAKFIVFEGIDGCGKSTQINRLAGRMIRNGRKVYKTMEPTASSIGGLIRDTLEGHHARSQDEMAALLAADRITHNINSKNGIQGFLKKGIDVLCDRYYYSTFAYQANAKNLEWIIDMNTKCPSIAKPDLCIFLDLDPDKCYKRIANGRPYAEIFESIEWLKHTRRNFLNIIQNLKDTENIFVIDASKGIDEISDIIWQEVEKNLAF